MQCRTTMLTVAVIALVWITWGTEAAPLVNTTSNTTEMSAGAGNETASRVDLPQFEFSYNCSSEDMTSKNESNSTYLDFAIGLFVVKDYLKGVRSNFNMTIAMEDEESFVPCYPPPVNTARLVQLKPLGDRATKVTHMAAWYGVLAAYARYTAELLEDKEELPRQVAKKLTTVYQMLQSVLQLFTDVIGPLSCTNDFEIHRYEYNDHTQCTESFDTLKFAANMVTHLQSTVSDVRDVQKNWYTAASIRRYLQPSLAKDLRPTWISRYTSSC